MMYKIRVTPEQYDRIVKGLGKSAAVVKMVCGVCNNAAWLVMLRGFEHAQQCGQYRGNAKRLFKRAIKEWHDYEHKLLYAKNNRMFHVADMTENIRRKYGDITDQQYFEFWEGAGGPAYQKSQPFITSLWNKYRLSLKAHSVADAEHVAWLLTTSSALMIAISMQQKIVRHCAGEFRVPLYISQNVFAQFSLQRVYDTWVNAMMTMCPLCFYELDDVERRNIEYGVSQLRDEWMSPTTLYQSTADSVKDFSEVFATDGFKKMVLEEIDKFQKETEEQLIIDEEK